MKLTPLTDAEKLLIGGENNNNLEPTIKPAAGFRLTQVDANSIPPKEDGWDYVRQASQRLMTNYQYSKNYNPNDIAQKARLEQQTGVPVQHFVDSPDRSKVVQDLAISKEANDFGWDTFIKNNPVLANHLAEMKHMAMAQDDLSNLAKTEDVVSHVQLGIRLNNLQIQQETLAYQQIFGDESPRTEKQLQAIEAQIDQLNRTAPNSGDFAPAFFVANQIPNAIFSLGKAAERGFLFGSIGAGAAFVGGQLGPQILAPEEIGTVPTAFVGGLGFGGVVGRAEATFIIEAGSAYREFIKMKDKNGRPLDRNIAKSAAIGVGAINAGLESLALKSFLRMLGPVGKDALELISKKEAKDLLKKYTSKEALRKAAIEYFKGIATETGTEIGQEISSIAMEGLAKTTSGQQFEKGRPGETAERIGGVVSATIQATAANPLALLGLGGNVMENMRQVRQAQVDHQVYQTVGQISEQSEYKKRTAGLSSGWRSLVSGMTAGDKLEHIYVDADQFTTLMQSKVPDDPTIAQKVADQLGIGDQLQQAIESGDSLKIPYATWLDQISGTEIYKEMEQHIKFDPEGLTLHQAALVEAETSKAIESEQAKMAEYLQSDEARLQGHEAVYTAMRDQLTQSGRPEQVKERDFNSWVDKNARLWAAHAVAEGTRRGMRPDEWYQNQMVQIEQTRQAAPDGSQARGVIEISPKGSIIRLYGNADASTFIHESAHLFLSDMHQFVKNGNPDEDYAASWKTLSQWLDLKEEQGQLTTDQQEKFAAGFEKYLMEGKTPSEGLKKVFAAMKRWMTKIYQSVRGLNVDLTDDVRKVMDRMLATDEEIAQAEATVNGSAEPDYSQYPEQVAKSLQKIRNKSLERAKEVLMGKQIGELQPERQDLIGKERKRMTGIIEENLLHDQLYRAEAEIQRARDFKKLGEADTVALMFREGRLDETQKERFERIAEAHRYSCGDELAQRILGSPSLKDAVSQQLEEHMAQFNDLANSDMMKEEAIKALHNEDRLEMLAMESRALEDLSLRKNLSSQALTRGRMEATLARQQAKKIMADKTWMQAVKPAYFFGAEKRAAVQAAGELAKGNYLEAAQYKRRQVLNHALAMEAMQIKEEAAKMFRLINKYANAGKGLASMPVEFADQVEALLERFGLSKSGKLDSPYRKPLAEFVKDAEEDYHILPVPQVLLSESWSKDYKEMKLKELRWLYTGVKVLSQYGRNFNRFLSFIDRANISMAASNTRSSIEKNIGTPYQVDKEGIGSPVRTQTKEFTNTLGKIPDAIAPWLIKAETVCRFLDRGQEDGPMQRYVYKPINRAFDAEARLTQKVIGDYGNLLSKYYSPQEFAAMKKDYKYFDFGDFGERKLSMEEIICVALNWGNGDVWTDSQTYVGGNRARIMQGFGRRNENGEITQFPEEHVNTILDHLTRKDWDMVQDIWDYMESFWPEIQKLEEDVSGVAPGKVEARPVETKFGTYRGGYYPIDYDPEKSAEAFKNEEQRNALYQQYSAAHAMTAHGHTQARVAVVNRAINLSFDVMTKHLVNITHDLTHRRAVIDVNRFLKQRDTVEAVTNAIGQRGYKMLTDWVKSVATDQGESLNLGDRLFRYMRQRMTIAQLGLAPLRFVKDIGTNTFMMAWEIGMVPTARSLTNYVLNAGQVHEFVTSKSAFMAQRALNRDRDIYDFSRRTFKGDKGLQTFFMSLNGMADEAVSIPAWKEAYFKYLVEFSGDEELAIEAADGVVRRTFGSGATKDLAKAQRGNEAQKAFTMYYSYMNMMLNRFWLDAKLAGVESQHGNQQAAITIIAKATFYGFVMQNIVEGVIDQFFKSRDDDDDDDKKYALLKRFATFGPSMIPYVRDITAYAVDKFTGHYADYKMSPIEGYVETSLNAFSGEPDKFFRGASHWFGYPQWINDASFTFMDWISQNGEVVWKDFISRQIRK